MHKAKKFHDIRKLLQYQVDMLDDIAEDLSSTEELALLKKVQTQGNKMLNDLDELAILLGYLNEEMQ